MHEGGFVGDLAVVLGVAAVTGFLFSLLKQPSILGYLLAGLIVGPYLPFPLFADPSRVHALSEFGVVLVMFAVGLEFRISKFLTVLPVAGITGVVEMGALLTAGYFMGIFLGWSDVHATFLGACLCISSTMAVSKILEQQPLPDENRRLIYGVLVLQDVAAIALIAVMTAVAQGNRASMSEVMGILGKLSAALAAIVAGGMFFVPRFMRMLERTKSKEVLVVGGVGLCFSFALLAEEFGYSPALGAFMGGILVAESGLGHQVETATASVRDVFVAVFFVSIGMSVDPRVAFTTLPTSLAVVSVIIVTQLVSVALAGTASGNGIKTSMTAGLALGQIGEFAFIIGGIGVSSGILGNEFQSILVSVAVISTFTTSLAVRYRGQFVALVHKAIPESFERMLVLYESWWRQLREPTQEPHHKIRTVVATIAFDLAVMAAVILSWQAWRGEIASYLVGTFKVGEELSQTLASLALGLALLPLLATLFISARSLSRKLADRVFDSKKSSARALLTTVVSALLVAMIGIPGTLVLGRTVGIAYVWPAFAFALVISSWIVWRRVGTLDSEMHSGGRIMLEAIADQGFSDVERHTRPTLPGIKNLHEVTLEEGSFAVGSTLAALNLRSRTGASVIAIASPRGDAALATGSEELEPGSILFVAGTAEAQERAEGLLLRGEEPPSQEDASDSNPSSATHGVDG